MGWCTSGSTIRRWSQFSLRPWLLKPRAVGGAITREWCPCPSTNAPSISLRQTAGGASYVLPWSDVPGVSPSAIVNDKNTNNVFVYVGKVGRPVVRALHSRLTFHKHCDNFYKRVEEKAVIPVVKVFDLTSQFPVPYSLR